MRQWSSYDLQAPSFSDLFLDSPSHVIPGPPLITLPTQAAITFLTHPDPISISWWDNEGKVFFSCRMISCPTANGMAASKPIHGYRIHHPQWIEILLLSSKKIFSVNCPPKIGTTKMGTHTIFLGKKWYVSLFLIHLDWTDHFNKTLPEASYTFFSFPEIDPSPVFSFLRDLQANALISFE